RELVAPLRGGRSFSAKLLRIFFAEKPLEDRSPDSGAAGPQAARQRGGSLPDTTNPHLLHQKFRKKFSIYRNTIRIKDNKKNVPLVCKQWRFPYLQHSEFIIRTNQRSLVHLEDQRLHLGSRRLYLCYRVDLADRRVTFLYAICTRHRF